MYLFIPRVLCGQKPAEQNVGLPVQNVKTHTPSVPSIHIMCVFPSEEFLPMEKSRVCVSSSTQPRTCESTVSSLTFQSHTRKSLCCVPHQGEVGFGDGAVLEAAVSSAGGGLIEGDAKRPARGEIQLMTEPVERNTARLSIRTLTFT